MIRAALLALLLAGAPTLAADPAPDCATRFATLGDAINQEDPYFSSCGLIRPGEPSALCGVTSLANLLNSLPESASGRLKGSAAAEQIAKEGQAYVDRKSSRQNPVTLRGMFPFQLGDLTRTLVKKRGLPYRVEVRDPLVSVSGIKPSDLRVDHGAVWAISFARGHGPDHESGHFVWILDYDPEKRVVTFSDPLNPGIPKQGAVSYKVPFTPGSDEFRIDLLPGTDMKELVGEEDGHFVVDGVIRLRAKPPAAGAGPPR